MNTIQILKDHNLRNTAFRQNVLDIFLTNRGKALTSTFIEDELVEVDRITLYRTLKSFEEKGIIHHAPDGSNTNKYALCDDLCTEDHNRHAHAHFHCIKCGDTKCLHDSLKHLDYTVPNGFNLQTVEVILTGVCPSCK